MVEVIVTDAGKSQSKRPKQKKDCAVRAIATMVDGSYDAIYDAVKVFAGRKCGGGTPTKAMRQWLNGLTLNGWSIRWVPCNAVKGQRRICLATFPTLGVDRAIVMCAKHVVAYKDGCYHDDTHNLPQHKCVYGYYEFTR